MVMEKCRIRIRLNSLMESFPKTKDMAMASVSTKTVRIMWGPGSLVCEVDKGTHTMGVARLTQGST